MPRLARGPILVILAGLVALLAIVVGLVWLGGAASEPSVEQSYDALTRDLQTELVTLDDDESWLEPQAEREPSGFWAALGQWLGDMFEAIGDGLIWFFNLVFSRTGLFVLGLVVLGVVGFLIVKYGRLGGLRLREAANDAAYPELQVETAQHDSAQAPSVAEIRAMSDLPRALGALLALALQAAAHLAGVVLSRSDTAREALRQLPRDFALLGVIERLVREAERVRFAGQTITQEQFDALVASVEDLIQQAEAGS